MILLAVPLAAVQTKQVLVIRVNGVINPVSSEFISKGIKKAIDMQAEALVIELDTPGGLDNLNAKHCKRHNRQHCTCCCLCVSSGARSASAEFSLQWQLMLQPCHLEQISVLPILWESEIRWTRQWAEKATNDASAYIKSLAERTGRNAKWAEDAVRKSVSLTETEALKENVIDLISKDLKTLLKDIDGKKLRLQQEKRSLPQTTHP